MTLEWLIDDLTHGQFSRKSATDTLYWVTMVNRIECVGDLKALDAVLCAAAYLFSGISADDVMYAPCSRPTPPHAPLAHTASLRVASVRRDTSVSAKAFFDTARLFLLVDECFEKVLGAGAEDVLEPLDVRKYVAAAGYAFLGLSACRTTKQRVPATKESCVHIFDKGIKRAQAAIGRGKAAFDGSWYMGLYPTLFEGCESQRIDTLLARSLSCV